MARSEVRGGSDVARTLRRMSRGVSREELRGARRQALEPMQAAARGNFVANGSLKTGVIPDNISIVDTGPNETRLGMTGMGARLGHLIELGTAPHAQPKRRTYHPGAAPKPFMRPAFDETREETLRRMGDAVGRALTRLALASRK